MVSIVLPSGHPVSFQNIQKESKSMGCSTMGTVGQLEMEIFIMMMPQNMQQT